MAINPVQSQSVQAQSVASQGVTAGTVPRQSLSQMAQLSNFSEYVQTRSIQETKIAASPVAIGTYTGRDPTTGQAIMATPAGGTLRAGTITSGAIQRGAVVPRLTTSRRGTGYADSMPARRV